MDTKFVKSFENAGMTWEAYLAVMEKDAAVDPGSLKDLAAERAEFSKLNLHRTRRIERTWKPSGDLLALVERLPAPQAWLVLTETWCGDSAQCLPMIVRMAEAAGDVTLRILLRDDNLDLMDRYLTDGKQAIPKLVAFDAEGGVLFHWGARPAAAQAVMDEALAEGLEKPERLERLHLFYGRDRGRALDAEFVDLFSSYLEGTP